MAQRILIVGALVLGVLLVGAQLVLPGYAANRIDDRLTEGGGDVDVSVESLPAVRLIFGDGDRLSVSGGGPRPPPQQGRDGVYPPHRFRRGAPRPGAFHARALRAPSLS